jgi:hypothetical protein
VGTYFSIREKHVDRPSTNHERGREVGEVEISTIDGLGGVGSVHDVSGGVVGVGVAVESGGGVEVRRGGTIQWQW